MASPEFPGITGVADWPPQVRLEPHRLHQLDSELSYPVASGPNGSMNSDADPSVGSLRSGRRLGVCNELLSLRGLGPHGYHRIKG